MLRFLRMKVHAGALAVFAFAAVFACLLAGCVCDMSGHEDASTDFEKVEEHDLFDFTFLPGTLELEGSITVPLRAFTPTAIRIALLDSSLNVVDSAGAKLGSMNGMFRYYANATYFNYPFVQISVEGTWNIHGDRGTVTFQSLADISKVPQPSVGLMTHLEVPIVRGLVEEGYPFYVAKRMALLKIEDAFGFENSSYVSGSEAQIRKDEYMLYAVLMRDKGEGAFADNLERMRDGLLDDAGVDEADLLDFADYLLGNWLSVDSMFNSWDNKIGESLWRNFENVLELAYGLDSCEAGSVQIEKIAVKDSRFYGDSLVCDVFENGRIKFRRFLTERETVYGPCIFIDSADVDIVFKGDSLYFTCHHTPVSYYKTSDSTESVHFYERWPYASEGEILTFHFGTCSEATAQKQSVYKDSVAMCEWTNKHKGWTFVGHDTLTALLGPCDTASLWNLEKSRDSLEYVCTPDSWQPANDVNRLLSQQEPCNRKTDQFRTLRQGFSYFVCSDVRVFDVDVYTFKDTTRKVVDSLEFIGSLPPCRLADTAKYVADTVNNRYYHCAIKGNVLKYYEVDFWDAESYFVQEFAKGLEPCTAASDTLEVLYDPYLSGRGSNAYFHCANVDGKYEYKRIDRETARTLWSLALVNQAATCASAGDSLVAVYDSTYGRYFHCEEIEGGYGFVPVDKSAWESYTSFARMAQLECDAESDTVEYRQDGGFFYYCEDRGGAFAYSRVKKAELQQILVDDFYARLPECDMANGRWQHQYVDFLGLERGFVCDYDADSNFVRRIVGAYDYESYRRKALKDSLDLRACPEEIIAARGTPVEVEDGYITDPRDGRRYRVTTIGTQTWMAENLAYSDETATPNLEGMVQCPGDTSKGCLYRWTAAMNLPDGVGERPIAESDACLPMQGACPAGWHLPTKAEWDVLLRYVAQIAGGDYGDGLKTVDGWGANNKSEDVFGFSVEPVLTELRTDLFMVDRNVKDYKNGLGSGEMRSFRTWSGVEAHELSISKSLVSVRCLKD